MEEQADPQWKAYVQQLQAVSSTLTPVGANRTVFGTQPMFRDTDTLPNGGLTVYKNMWFNNGEGLQDVAVAAGSPFPAYLLRPALQGRLHTPMNLDYQSQATVKVLQAAAKAAGH